LLAGLSAGTAPILSGTTLDTGAAAAVGKEIAGGDEIVAAATALFGGPPVAA
jgi:hypothetical protein